MSLKPSIFQVGTPVRFPILTYDADGEAIDADSTPVGTAGTGDFVILKNGSVQNLTITVAKRAGETGIYDCFFDPSGEAEGDVFQITENVTIGGTVYTNAWSITAIAPERGTDGANTVTPNTIAPVDVSADVAAILADTDELQQNQGDWLTASGFNTVAPDNASISAILADTDELQQNQGDWLTATGFNTIAPDNASIAAILLDTDELQGNQGDWLTATTVIASNMRGTDNALLASSAPANWSIMSVNGSGAITTSNPSTGGTGSAHTAQDVANLILLTPANKLATDASGNVEASNMRGTDGANTIAPATPANVTAAQSALETRLDTVDSDNLSISNGINSIVSKIDAIDLIVDAILLDTDDLQSNQGDWLTATGFATNANITAAVAPLLTESDFLDELPNNFAVLDITAAGLVTCTNGGGGGGDDAATIFAYFNNQDLTNFQADVTGLALETTVVNGTNQIITVGNADWVTGSGGSGGTCGDSKEDIYAYFLTQDLTPFHADTSLLALEQTLTDGITQIITHGDQYWMTTTNTGGDLPPVDEEDFGIIKNMRKQYAWYFENVGKDSYGQPTYAAGVLINVRWDDFVSKDLTKGRMYENDAKATVYLSQRVKVGDILMREEVHTGPAPIADIDFIVRDYKEYPNIRNTAQLRIAIL